MTLQFHSDELFISHVSRFARLQGLAGVGDLLGDVGVSAGDFHKGNRHAITKVAGVLNVDPEAAFARSFRRVDAQASEFMKLTLRERWLLRARFRICPACLRADIGPDLSQRAALNAYARTAWSFAMVRVCPTHQMSVISPPETGVAHEFVQTWEPWLPEVMEGDFDQPVQGTGLYEAFVARTLEGETQAPGWLGHFPIEALGMLCEFLGTAQLYGPDLRPSDCDPSDLSLGRDAGFALLSEGPAAIEALLLSLRTRPGPPQQRPQGRYGPMYDWLKRSGGSGPEFEPMRSLLRRHILDTWPLGPGSHLLGDRITERRFHSILTASAEYDMRASHVANLLRDAQLEGALDLPEFEKIYPAGPVNDILDAVSGSLSMSRAETQLGMTRTQLETLLSAGFLRYSLGGMNARPRFSQKDISTFKEQHRKFPASRTRGHPRTDLTVAEASRQYGKSVVELYRLIVDGTLKGVSRESDSLLFSDLLINAQELATLMARDDHDDHDEFMPMYRCVKELALGPNFIRELGAKGYLDIFDVLDARSYRPKSTIPTQQVNDFVRTDVSRRRLARMNAAPVREVQKRVEKAGLVPVELSADGKESLFLVDDVLHVQGLNRGLNNRIR
ncbi:MAG: TniQ family protein [Rhodobacteraceae bacterium]|nr:TniQ family protein [Paracoccaceae bacterium]